MAFTTNACAAAQRARLLVFSTVQMYYAAAFNINSVWLFTYSDLKTMVVPSTAFALLTRLALCRGRGTQSVSTEGLFQDLTVTFTQSGCDRLPAVLLWTWTNLLAFTVDNQRTQQGIAEDTLNKPWRPIPSGRISRKTADRMANFTYPLALACSVFLNGGQVPSATLMVLGYLYNQGRGSAGHWLTRNALNGAGFATFAAGALEVATQAPVDVRATRWLAIIALVVTTSVHAQDMYDQEGDSAAGRNTLPLVIGDYPARWSIAIAVLSWSIICGSFWGCHPVGTLFSVALSLRIAVRTLTKTKVEDDKATFRLYNAWLVSLYVLPLIRA